MEIAIAGATQTRLRQFPFWLHVVSDRTVICRVPRKMGTNAISIYLIYRAEGTKAMQSLSTDIRAYYSIPISLELLDLADLSLEPFHHPLKRAIRSEAALPVVGAFRSTP
jgi:hypothetical protein